MAIERKTVLVLGAGAGVPYGFPTGRELTKKIIDESLDNSWLANLEFDVNPAAKPTLEAFAMLDEFKQSLLGSQLQSVDSFLEKRPKFMESKKGQIFMELGKALIGFHLLPIERRNSNPQSLTKKPLWYEYVWNQWHTKLPQELSNTNLSIITFNYDRTVEYMLLNSIQSTYNVPPHQAADLLLGLNIKHVYGSLGKLPERIGSTTDVPYGADPYNVNTLRNVIENIKIIHETDEIADAPSIHQTLKEAEVVCFLGFGYLPENMDRLFGNVKLDHKTIYGSGYGLTDAEMNAIGRYLVQFSNSGARPHIEISKGTSLQALREFPVFPIA